MKRTLPGHTPETAALECYLKLMRASEKIASETHRHLTKHELTRSQFAIMEALYHLGPLSQRELGKKVLKSHGNVTTVINNLENRKLVKRRRSCEDRRFYSVSLSEAGKQLIEEVFPQHVSRIIRSLSPLTAAEQHELARLSRKLGLS